MAWSGFKAPVVPLALAFYNHPDVGSCWDTWDGEKMHRTGFHAIDGWPGSACGNT